MGTNYTQFVHRMRLRPVFPQNELMILLLSIENFQRDPLLGEFRGERTLFDASFPSLLQPPTRVMTTRVVTEDRSATCNY